MPKKGLKRKHEATEDAPPNPEGLAPIDLQRKVAELEAVLQQKDAALEHALEQKDAALKEIERLKAEPRRLASSRSLHLPGPESYKSQSKMWENMSSANGHVLTHLAFLKCLDAMHEAPSDEAETLAAQCLGVLDRGRAQGSTGLLQKPGDKPGTGVVTSNGDKYHKCARFAEGRVCEPALTCIIGSLFGPHRFANPAARPGEDSAAPPSADAASSGAAGASTEAAGMPWHKQSAQEKRKSVSSSDPQPVLVWGHQAVTSDGGRPDLCLFRLGDLMPYAFVEFGCVDKEQQMFPYAVRMLSLDCRPNMGKRRANRAMLGLEVRFNKGNPDLSEIKLYGYCLLERGSETPADMNDYDRVLCTLLFHRDGLSDTKKGADFGQGFLARCFHAMLKHGENDGYPTSPVARDARVNVARYGGNVYKLYSKESHRSHVEMLSELGADVYHAHEDSCEAAASCTWGTIISYPFVEGTHKPSTVGHILAVLQQLAGAHAREVVHCDIRGFNLVFHPDDACKSKIIDWDLARKPGTPYPETFNHDIPDGGRHQDARANAPAQFAHDLHGLWEFAKHFEVADCAKSWQKALKLLKAGRTGEAIDAMQKLSSAALTCSEDFHAKLTIQSPVDGPVNSRYLPGLDQPGTGSPGMPGVARRQMKATRKRSKRG